MVTDEPNLITSENQVQPPALGLWQQIQEDWIAHGRDWTKPGFRAVAVQRFGVWRMLSIALPKSPQHLRHRFALYGKARPSRGD